METDITKQFKENLFKELTSAGITGKDRTEAMNLKETDDSSKYLADGVTMDEILKMVKNKDLNNTSLKKELIKKLKNPDDIKVFLRSIKPKTKTETKEATGTAGSSGSFEPLFSGEEPKKVETKEATSTSSVGSYDAPGFQDVKMKGNTPKGKGRSWKRTQIPGGNFVSVKDKCKKYPYCNQGIGAINIFENETLQRVISKISNEYGLHEEIIKDVILSELNKNKK
jgi:hypothetical protein